MSCHCTPLRTAIIKKDTNKCWQGCGEKRIFLTLSVRMSIGAPTMENSMEVSQKRKSDLLCDPAIPLLAIHLKKTTKSLIGKDTRTLLFIAG